MNLVRSPDERNAVEARCDDEETCTLDDEDEDDTVVVPLAGGDDNREENDRLLFAERLDLTSTRWSDDDGAVDKAYGVDEVRVIGGYIRQINKYISSISPKTSQIHMMSQSQ